MHDVAWRGMWICVRSSDAQKQLARTSLILTTRSGVERTTFSSPEAALLLVSTKNRDLLLSPTPEVRDSRTSRHPAHAQRQVWQIWLVLVSIYCVYKAIQNQNVVGPGQRSRSLVLTKRSAASGDENEPTNDDPLYLQFPVSFLFKADVSVKAGGGGGGGVGGGDA